MAIPHCVVTETIEEVVRTVYHRGDLYCDPHELAPRELLEAFLQDPHPAVRAEAVAGLRRLHSAASGCALAPEGEGLAQVAPRSPRPDDRWLGREALGAVIAASRDVSLNVRAEALPLICLAGCTGVRTGEGVGGEGGAGSGGGGGGGSGGGGVAPAGSDAFSALCDLAGDPDREIRSAACRALGCPLAQVDPALLASSLRGIRGLDGVPGTFAMALQDEFKDVRSAAVGSLCAVAVRRDTTEETLGRAVAFLVRFCSPPPPPPPILAPPNVRTPSPGLTHCGRVIGIKGPLPWPVVHDPSARVIGQLRTWQGAFFFLACPAQFTVVNPLCC